MKIYIRHLLLISAFILILSLLFIFPVTHATSKKPVTQNLVPQHQKAVVVASKLPVRLKIPAIKVDANIQQLGINQLGEMDVPSNIVDVGWFKFGVIPGDDGSAVIDGHFDGKNGEAGVFANLYKLKKGDKINIEDNKGSSITFIVQGSRAYDPGYAEDVFDSSGSARLNLITCNGVWDKNKKSYSKRLVVFADLERE